MSVVSFPLDGGGEVLVHVEPQARDGEVVTRGGRDYAVQAMEEAKHTFDSALSTIRVVAEGVLDQLSGLGSPPTEVRVQFGLEFNAKAGALMVSAGATAQLRVDMAWNPHTRKQDTESGGLPKAVPAAEHADEVSASGRG
ncbi:CU044_2847 family protein [Nocardia gipuzkoensis]